MRAMERGLNKTRVDLTIYSVSPFVLLNTQPPSASSGVDKPIRFLLLRPAGWKLTFDRTRGPALASSPATRAFSLPPYVAVSWVILTPGSSVGRSQSFAPSEMIDAIWTGSNRLVLNRIGSRRSGRTASTTELQE